MVQMTFIFQAIERVAAYLHVTHDFYFLVTSLLFYKWLSASRRLHFCSRLDTYERLFRLVVMSMERAEKGIEGREHLKVLYYILTSVS